VALLFNATLVVGHVTGSASRDAGKRRSSIAVATEALQASHGAVALFAINLQMNTKKESQASTASHLVVSVIDRTSIKSLVTLSALGCYKKPTQRQVHTFKHLL
jgi:hypothetical protein